ncbi:unnamed protein product, partial [Laminaria digitata]
IPALVLLSCRISLTQRFFSSSFFGGSVQGLHSSSGRFLVPLVSVPGALCAPRQQQQPVCAITRHFGVFYATARWQGANICNLRSRALYTLLWIHWVGMPTRINTFTFWAEA